MSILILNVLSHDRCPYEQFLKDTDEDLILLTSKEKADGFNQNDYAYIEAFDNYRTNERVEQRAVELYDQFQYHTVLANTEADILRAARLRQRFNLKGQSISSAINYRDKVVMKTKAQEHGIKTPPFAKITCIQDLEEFIKEHHYPVLVKPIDGAASQGIIKIENRRDLIELRRQGLPQNYMVEKFIKGDLCHVDGIIHNGELRFIAASKYLNPPMEFLDGSGFLGAYTLDPDKPLAQRLVNMTKKVLDSFDTPENTIFHAEWFHTPDHKIIFCEIASRTAGGITMEMIKHAFNIHLYQAFTQIHCGLPLTLNHTKPKQLAGLMQIGPEPGIFIQGPTKQPPSWIRDYQLLIEPGQSFLDDPDTIREFIASFVVVGDTESQVRDRLWKGYIWFSDSKWEITDIDH